MENSFVCSKESSLWRILFIRGVHISNSSCTLNNMVNVYSFVLVYTIRLLKFFLSQETCSQINDAERNVNQAFMVMRVQLSFLKDRKKYIINSLVTKFSMCVYATARISLFVKYYYRFFSSNGFKYYRTSYFFALSFRTRRIVTNITSWC